MGRQSSSASEPVSGDGYQIRKKQSRYFRRFGVNDQNRALVGLIRVDIIRIEYRQRNTRPAPLGPFCTRRPSFSQISNFGIREKRRTAAFGAQIENIRFGTCQNIGNKSGSENMERWLPNFWKFSEFQFWKTFQIWKKLGSVYNGPYLHSLVEVPEADGVDDLKHALVGCEGVRLLLEYLVDPEKALHRTAPHRTATQRSAPHEQVKAIIEKPVYTVDRTT